LSRFLQPLEILSFSQALIEQLMMIAMKSPDLSTFQRENYFRLYSLLDVLATASQVKRSVLFQHLSEFEWGEEIFDFEHEQE
jgi:hypothetical protein